VKLCPAPGLLHTSFRARRAGKRVAIRHRGRNGTSVQRHNAQQEHNNAQSVLHVTSFPCTRQRTGKGLYLPLQVLFYLRLSGFAGLPFSASQGPSNHTLTKNYSSRQLEAAARSQFEILEQGTADSPEGLRVRNCGVRPLPSARQSARVIRWIQGSCR
jgi:hypothetical protein